MGIADYHRPRPANDNAAVGATSVDGPSFLPLMNTVEDSPDESSLPHVQVSP